MDSSSDDSSRHVITEQDIQQLKAKYSIEMKDDIDNPIKVCIKLIFEAATERNSAKRNELSKSLSEFLTGHNGVINLFLALVDFDTSSQKVTTHNQRFTAVANIIACLPELCMPYSEYCQIIFNQLKPLLLSNNKQYSTLACIIVKSILESNHAQRGNIEEIILGPILEPFTMHENQIKPHESIIIIHNLIQNHVSTNLFVEIFPNLFYALESLESTPSRLKSLLKISIASILNALKPGPACCLLDKVLFHCDDLKQKYIPFAEDEDISIRIINDESMSYERPCVLIDLVISILENSGNELLVLEVFFHFKEAMLLAKRDEDRLLSSALVESLLQRSVEEKSDTLDLMTLVATNGKRSLELVARTLLNYVSFFRSKQDSLAFKMISQSICSCCSILEVLSVTLGGKEENQLIERKCIPVLRELSKLLESQTDLGKPAEELGQTIRSLNARLEGNLKGEPPVEDVGSSGWILKKEFESITRDLNDRLVPVRVHAMVRLKQMIIANDQFVTEQIPQIYRLTLCFLGDVEPYVFLACINLMAEMAIRRTETILPKLRELYLDGSLELQRRLNIGEVLVRLFRQLNATAPHYAQQVINVLYSGCKDAEELIRMSSLTSIGELCRNLGESLGKHMVEILEAVESVLNCDTIEVKCAALDLLRSLLSGLRADNMESVQRDLKLIYQLLKRAGHKEANAKFRLHLELVLDEVNRLARELLGAGSVSSSVESLVKNIKVLSILPDR